MKKTLTFYTLVFIAATGLMRLSGLASKIILARSITPYEYGLITLVVISLPMMLQVPTNLFFYEILSHSTRGSKYFGFSMLYATVVSVVIALGAFVFHEEIFAFLNIPLDGWEYLFLAIFIVVIPNSYITNVLGLLRGHKRYNITSSLIAAPSVVRVFILGIAVYAFSVKDFNSILILFAAPAIIVTGFVFVKERRRIWKRTRKAHMPSKDMMFFGISVFVVGMFANLVQGIAKVVISHDMGVEMQGYFDVSFSILTLLAFSFTAMQFISIPEATGSRDKKELLYKRGELGDILRALLAFLILCVIVICFYSTQLITLLFSEAYAKAGEYIYILAFANIFLFAQQFLAYVNISTSKNNGEHKSLLLITVVAIAVFPLITHYMISWYGFMGAYLACSSFLVLYSLATIFSSKDRSPLRALMYKGDRLLFSSIATSALLFYANMDIVAGLIASSAVYALLIFSSGYLHKELLLEIFMTKKTGEAI